MEHCPTEEMVGDFFTKPLQGSLFRKFRAIIMNLPPDLNPGAQECVGDSGSGEGVEPRDSTPSNKSRVGDAGECAASPDREDTEV